MSNEEWIARAVWNEAMRDPAFVAGMERGRADIEAGRVTPWKEVRKQLMTDDLTTPEKPAPPDLKDDGEDDEALPDVKNDPIPEPAQPEPEGT